MTLRVKNILPVFILFRVGLSLFKRCFYPSRMSEIVYFGSCAFSVFFLPSKNVIASNMTLMQSIMSFL